MYKALHELLATAVSNETSSKEEPVSQTDSPEIPRIIYSSSSGDETPATTSSSTSSDSENEIEGTTLSFAKSRYMLSNAPKGISLKLGHRDHESSSYETEEECGDNTVEQVHTPRPANVDDRSVEAIREKYGTPFLSSEKFLSTKRYHKLADFLVENVVT